MHFMDWLLIAALLLGTVFAVRHIVKQRGSCCGDCASCGKRCTHRNATRGK